MNGSDNTPSRPQSMSRPSRVFSSLPPLSVYSSLPPSPVYSSSPPLSPSPSSLCCNSLRSRSLSPTLLCNSPSGIKRRAGKFEPSRKHHRSVSMDSCFINLLTPPPSPSNVSSTSSVDGDENISDLEYGDEEYTADELKKISECAKLTELASDPKKVRRILKKRESASRSNQRKSQYITDLKNRLKFLEDQNTLMSEKIPLLEKDKIMMMAEKEEIKIRLESLEQQAQLRDEMERLKGTTTLNEQVSVKAQQLKEVTTSNEQLSLEIQRLKMVIGEMMQNNAQIDPNNFQRLTINELNKPQTKPDF